MRTKTVSARVEVGFYERVKAEAERRGVTVSDIVRGALERELSGDHKPWWGSGESGDSPDFCSTSFIL